MEAACVNQTDLPHTSRLFADFSYHFDRVSRFYAYPPRSPESVRKAASAIDYPDDRRRALVDALRRQNGDSPALAKLAQPGTVAIVTGQQVGLFSGPAYTMYKALTAARLASVLTEQGIPAVPVFWLATEDHDIAEVDHSWNFGIDHQPVVLRAEARSDGQRPVGHIPITTVPTEELAALLEPFPYGSQAAAVVAAAYRPGATLGEAFRSLMKSLLGRFDLLYLDPLAEDIRAICGPFLREAIEHAPELKDALISRNSDLQSEGYHAQVHLERQTSLFFLLRDGRRITLRNQNGVYTSKDGQYSPQELAAVAEHLSPNALLRPVMQDYLLPTAVYIGGPAELAYLAQAQVLYGRLLGRMPVVEHRSGFTILDSRARKLIDRYHLAWEDVFLGEAGVREAIASRLVPLNLQNAFGTATRSVEMALFGVGRELGNFDPTLVAALEKSRSKMLYQLSKLERKAAHEALRREARAQEEARFLSGLLYPNKHLQERLYSILPFIAKHGFELLDQVYEQISPECPDHQILVV